MTRPGTPTLVFDADCGVCTRLAGFARRRLPDDAEVIGWQELLELGSWSKAKDAGKLRVEGKDGVVTIEDNGIGLPADRARLFEPYVTTREKGTGLGLPIVKKIIEEHGGTLVLEDAELFGHTDRPGARAVVRLPIKSAEPRERDAAE